jgi:hypothetical protein
MPLHYIDEGEHMSHRSAMDRLETYDTNQPCKSCYMRSTYLICVVKIASGIQQQTHTLGSPARSGRK